MPASLSLTGATWAPKPVSPEQIATARSRSGLSPIAARCLATRMPNAGTDWLKPSIDHLHDPFAMKGMNAAVDRLQRALRERQKVRIITDYDVDGTTSSLILQATLRLLRPDLPVDYHIPNRFDEGYGFSLWAAQQAAEDGVDLIVTADIGVRDHVAVAAARNAGVDVLVCDHHLPAGAAVPEDATVLCPPQVGCDYPNGSLAACGVSLKLAQALLASHPKREAVLLSLLKLAAIGTVADLVPLDTLENRAIVALGLRNLNQQAHHAGLQSLLDVCRLGDRPIRESDLGFRVGPRINAAGRVADAKMVVRLLNCRDRNTARDLAKELDQLNTHRRDLQARVTQEALAAIGEPVDPFVVVAGWEEKGWHRGVVGIVASRVKDEVHRPAAVVSIQGDKAVGSVRSIRGVHAVRALESVGDLLVKFGGHPAAAGFTVKTSDIDALRERLCDYVRETTTADDLVPVRRVDAEARVDELSDHTFHELAQLGPFGMGNPRPQLVVRNVRPLGVRLIGKDQNMMKFVLRGQNRGLEAIWWGKPEHAPVLGANSVDLLGKLGENIYRGRRTLQLEITDARLAS